MFCRGDVISTKDMSNNRSGTEEARCDFHGLTIAVLAPMAVIFYVCLVAYACISVEDYNGG
jgi:hypothetical protein